MKGRQRGRPTKWVETTVLEYIDIGKRGIQFEVWEKWKQTKRKLGTLTISVGGLRWWPQNGKRYKQKNWDDLAYWFNPRIDA
jgi:hypothetical protein